MIVAARGSLASAHLDLIRGLAALGVFFGHARNLFFVDYQQVQNKGLAIQALYFLTGFGHQCVMIFFVLSGYFISTGILREIQRGTWSWRVYLTNRLVRLYVVLIPALLLTLLWDSLGRTLSGHLVYSGVGDQNIVHDVGERTGIATFLGNALFLQNVLVPPLGSNGPLWSLSNEFWYYILFPALCVLFTRRRLFSVLAHGALIAGIAILCDALLPAFPIWLLGTAVAILPQSKYLQRPIFRNVATIAAIVLFALVLAASRTFRHGGILLDYAVGLGFAALMHLLLYHQNPAGRGLYVSGTSLLANMSYTLYLVHLPFFLFLYAMLGILERFQPDGIHLFAICGLCAGVFLYALLLAALTEARTDTVRRFVLERLPGKHRLRSERG